MQGGGETALLLTSVTQRARQHGAIVEVCSLIFEQGLLSAQDAMCQTRTGGLKGEEVSPLWHFAV